MGKVLKGMRASFLLLFMLIMNVFCLSWTTPAYSNWTGPLGPVGGQINALAIDPANPQISINLTTCACRTIFSSRISPETTSRTTPQAAKPYDFPIHRASETRMRLIFSTSDTPPLPQLANGIHYGPDRTCIRQTRYDSHRRGKKPPQRGRAISLRGDHPGSSSYKPPNR